MSAKFATLLAGIPLISQPLYPRIRFAVGDSAAWIETIDKDENRSTTLLVRDIEMGRAREAVSVDRVGCAADFAPDAGLSADRDTALAQAVVECLRREGVQQVTTDRSLPFLFAWHLQNAGFELQYDCDLGVVQRRTKDEQELGCLQTAQAVTEAAMRMACETVARAEPDDAGLLHSDGELLTSERLRKSITRFLLEHNFSNPHDSIVATLPQSADCHDFGSGALRTKVPVIVDIFPRDNNSRYWGDCTRTVVHGVATDDVRLMHAAVVAAKQAGIAALRAGVTGDAVHAAVCQTLINLGFAAGPASEISDAAAPHMPHGTGHGIGLDVHEPILLDRGNGAVLENEVFTVEPGLYSTVHGGVRVEDMVVVTRDVARNLNRLHEGLDWN